MALFLYTDENSLSPLGNLTTFPQFTNEFWRVLEVLSCHGLSWGFYSTNSSLLVGIYWPVTTMVGPWNLVHKATLKIVFLVLSGLLALSMTFLPLSCLDSRKLGEWNCTPDFLGLAASPEPKSCKAFLCINHWLMHAVIAPSLPHWLPTPQTRKRFSNLEPRKSCIYSYFFNVDQVLKAWSLQHQYYLGTCCHAKHLPLYPALLNQKLLE